VYVFGDLSRGGFWCIELVNSPLRIHQKLSEVPWHGSNVFLVVLVEGRVISQELEHRRSLGAVDVNLRKHCHFAHVQCAACATAHPFSVSGRWRARLLRQKLVAWKQELTEVFVGKLSTQVTKQLIVSLCQTSFARNIDNQDDTASKSAELHWLPFVVIGA